MSSKSLQYKPGWLERSMFAQSKLLAMRKLSFSESVLLNQSGGSADEEERENEGICEPGRSFCHVIENSLYCGGG